MITAFGLTRLSILALSKFSNLPVRRVLRLVQPTAEG
jgi:hypothetical protein